MSKLIFLVMSAVILPFKFLFQFLIYIFFPIIHKLKNSNLFDSMDKCIDNQIPAGNSRNRPYLIISNCPKLILYILYINRVKVRPAYRRRTFCTKTVPIQYIPDFILPCQLM